MRKVAGGLRLELAQYRELEAFAQFGTELDQATQTTLARGERMVATLNQPQYKPRPHAEQDVALYAGINGFLDDVPVAQVPRFQDELVPPGAPSFELASPRAAVGAPAGQSPAPPATRGSHSSAKHLNLSKELT